MRPRATALVLLVVFAVLTVAAVVVEGTRPATADSPVATALRVAGYACVLGAAALLLRASGSPAPGGTAGRRLGIVLIAAFAALVVVEVLSSIGDPAGADMGLGLLRLLALLTVVATAVALARPARRLS